jgi:hypothetical protein
LTWTVAALILVIKQARRRTPEDRMAQKLYRIKEAADAGESRTPPCLAGLIGPARRISDREWIINVPRWFGSLRGLWGRFYLKPEWLEPVTEYGERPF